MSDTINVLQRVDNVEKAPLFNTYSRVVIAIDDETEASAGTSTTGRTLDLSNPLFGSASVAQKTLNRLQGFQYQPYKADGAILDPAAELGDAISANGVYGGIYTRDRVFGRLMKATVSAPHDEEINHEYQYETPTERKLKRQMGDVKAEFAIQATQIAAKVSQVGGTNSSFGWTLTSTAHTWYSGNTQVMKVNSSGLEVKGKITATSGYIGNGSQGFEITSTAIRNGMTSLTDTTHNGIYIGTNGIALGKGKFKVDTSGNITASGIRLQGTLTFLNADGTTAGTMSAADLRQGALRANNGYSNWNSAYNSTSAGGYCYGGAGYGYNFNDMVNNRYTATYLKGQYIYATSNISTPILIVGGTSATWHTKNFRDHDDNPVYISYLGSA